MAAKSSHLRWAVAVLIVASLATVGRLDSAAASLPAATPGHTRSRAGASGLTGTRSRFVFLARQRSNSCTLEPAALERMPDATRLQGSCCSGMNWDSYRFQVKGLRAYPSIGQIPKDPYDISVQLAKELLGYDHTRRLTRLQAQVYAQAMRSSREKGPCCCHCWRWNAFRGLSKYLIADRGWRAHAVATVIDLLDGCGGPAR